MYSPDSTRELLFAIGFPHCGQVFSVIFYCFCGAYLKPPLNFSVISIGSEARLESKIKGERGVSRVQRYEKLSKVPNLFEQKYTCSFLMSYTGDADKVLGWSNIVLICHEFCSSHKGEFAEFSKVVLVVCDNDIAITGLGTLILEHIFEVVHSLTKCIM